MDFKAQNESLDHITYMIHTQTSLKLKPFEIQGPNLIHLMTILPEIGSLTKPDVTHNLMAARSVLLFDQSLNSR